jgi:hypothetical protein
MTVESGDVVPPRTEQVIASVLAAVEEDIDAAVSAARAAISRRPVGVVAAIVPSAARQDGAR